MCSTRLISKNINQLSHGPILEKFIFERGRQTSETHKTAEKQPCETRLIRPKACSQLVPVSRGTPARRLILGRAKRAGEKIRWKGSNDSKVLREDIYLAFAQYSWIVVGEGRVRTDTVWGTFMVGYFGGCGEAKGTRDKLF